MDVVFGTLDTLDAIADAGFPLVLLLFAEDKEPLVVDIPVITDEVKPVNGPVMLVKVVRDNDTLLIGKQVVGKVQVNQLLVQPEKFTDFVGSRHVALPNRVPRQI